MKSQPKLLAVLTAAALSAGCASGGGGGEQHAQSAPRVSEQKPQREIRCPLWPIICYEVLTEEERLDRKLKEMGIRPHSTPPFTSWAELPPLMTAYYNTEVSYRYDTISRDLRYSQSSPTSTGSTAGGNCSHHVTHGPLCSTNVTSGQSSQGSIGWTAQGNVSESKTHGPIYDANRTLHTIFSFRRFDRLARFENLELVGQPGIDLAHRQLSEFEGGLSQWARLNKGKTPPLMTPFIEASAHEMALAANPYKLDWNYQSFGVWNKSQHIELSSFGAATPASTVPTIGNATFRGKLAGLYVSPTGHGSTATADLTVNANFSSRSLSFASSGTAITRDLKTATAAPNLNLSGALTYSPASNTFAGTLTNAGGTMSGSSTGRYYGPAAQELGGVFAVKSPSTVETLTGAYGAKR